MDNKISTCLFIRQSHNFKVTRSWRSRIRFFLSFGGRPNRRHTNTLVVTDDKCVVKKK